MSNNPYLPDDRRASSLRKVINMDVLPKFGTRFRAAGKTVVWTNGCFDLLHVGHVRYLEAARALGDVLLVGVNSDASVRGLKGPGRPLVPEAERAEILAALECVDYVVIFDEPTPDAALLRLRPDIHCKGGDYAGKAIPEAPVVASFGGRIEFLLLVPDHSTTDLVKRAREQLAAEDPGGA